MIKVAFFIQVNQTKLFSFSSSFFFNQNISIGVVGKNEKFHILNDEETARFVGAVEKRSGPPPDDGGGSGVVGGNEPATIDDFDEPRDDQRSGDPQPQVAVETMETQ